MFDRATITLGIGPHSSSRNASAAEGTCCSDEDENWSCDVVDETTVSTPSRHSVRHRN